MYAYSNCKEGDDQTRRRGKTSQETSKKRRESRLPSTCEAHRKPQVNFRTSRMPHPDNLIIDDIRDRVALRIDLLFAGIESDWPWPAEVVFRTLIEYGMHQV